MQTYRMGGVLYFAFLIFVVSEDIEKMDAGEHQTGCVSHWKTTNKLSLFSLVNKNKIKEKFDHSVLPSSLNGS